MNTAYRCRHACCTVTVEDGDVRGQNWKITLNGIGCTVGTLAAKLGVYPSTIQKRINHRSCLARVKQDRSPVVGSQAKDYDTTGASQTPAGRFAALRWPA